MEHGHGAPSGSGSEADVPGYQAGAFDWGFGSPSGLPPWVWDPTDPDELDSGFGSKFIILTVEIPADTDTARDTGGEILLLTSQDGWPNHGPFHVVAIDENLVEVACYGLRGGDELSAADCYTDRSGLNLRCGLPMLAPGLYTIKVNWLDGGIQTGTAASQLEVVYRTRHHETYRLRAMFPETVYTVIGPNRPDAEPLLG